MNTCYIDAHCHISSEIAEKQIGNIFKRNENFYLEKIICNATDYTDWDTVINLSLIQKDIVAFVGLHPWFVSSNSWSCLKKLEELILENPRLGIGEVGLDYSKKYVINKTLQEEIFIYQFELANKYKRPLSIHILKAWHVLSSIFSNNLILTNFLVHAFTAAKEIAELILKNGGYLSLAANTILNYKKVEFVKWLPLDRILIETDRFLFDRPNFKEDYILSIKSLYKTLAEIKNTKEEEIMRIISNNTKNYLQNIS